MSKKKVGALLMAATMAASAVVVGCGSTAADSTEAKQTAGTAAVKTESKEGTEASADNKLTIAIRKSSLITEYDDNHLTKYYEDLLGIDIDFVILGEDELATKVSLWSTSGEEVPDLLLAATELSMEASTQHGEAGFFLSVGDYLNDPSKMPNFNAIPEEDRLVMLQSAASADGNIYGFPYSVENPWNLTPYRYYVNKTWLDALGLSVPTTTAELKDVLIAFRDQDPNGNGIKDELPLYGRDGTYGENVLHALMNSFTFFNPDSANCFVEVDENGQIYAPYTTEEWKKGLMFMKELYDEGLLVPGVFTDDGTQFKAVLNSETNVVGVATVGSYGNWADTANNVNFRDMQMIAPLVGPEGVNYTPYYPYEPVLHGYIFAGSDNIDLAIRFMDECYNQDSAKVARYGVEGEHWTVDPEEMKGLENAYIHAGMYEEPSVVLYNNIWSVAGNYTWRDPAPRYQSLDEVLTVVDITNGREFDMDAPINLQATNMELYADKHPENVLPTLKFSSDESKQILDTAVNLPEFVEQAMAEFITGIRDIDSGWEQYLAELENIGLSHYMSVAQDVYDRTLR